MKRMTIITSIIIVIISLTMLNVSKADDTELPFFTDGVYYADLNDAINASQSKVITMVHDGRQEGNVDIPADYEFIINNGVKLYHTLNHINIYGKLTLYGEIIDTTSIRVYSGVTNLYGKITNTNVSAITVSGISTIYFSGVIISAANYAVSVTEPAIGSTLIVNGGTFYSSSQDNPLNPIDAFEFGQLSGVTIENGVITVTRNGGLLDDISQFVNESTNWIAIFLGAVVSQALLTLICTVAFVGLGIGLIKRIKR